MKKIFHGSALTLLLALALSATALAQQIVSPDTEVETKKRAQTGMKFLSTSVDARATAIGGAVMAETEGSSVSLFYNPASMAGMESNFHASFGNLGFITDINYNAASVAWRPGGGNYGVFGLSLISVDYGDFQGTIRANNEQGFIDTEMYKPTAMAIGVGYARSLTDRFSAGGQVKYALQDLGDGFITSQNFDTGGERTFADYSKSTVAVDFGVVYKTGFKSLVIAMAARNFSKELSYVRERFELPLTFQLGAQINALDFTSLDPDVHSLTIHADAARPRDFTEHIKFGAEYTFMDILSLRAGYENFVNEEQGISAGGGLHYKVSNVRFGADYAYTDFGLFGAVHRVGLNIGM